MQTVEWIVDIPLLRYRTLPHDRLNIADRHRKRTVTNP
jgi:hypothetical protein